MGVPAGSAEESVTHKREKSSRETALFLSKTSGISAFSAKFFGCDAFLKTIVNSNEVIVGVISSQVFSNVPAAILLSKFTENARDLLIGVNLGGLGTLIASMASLISFKFIAKEKVGTGKYILTFTIANFIFLILNLGLWLIIK